MSRRGRKGADDVLAGHLAAGLPIKTAAEKTGMGYRTARRRLEDPQFCRQVQRLKGEAVSQAVALLGRSMAGAAGVLARSLTSPDERIRLQAAREIIGLGLKARQAEDLEQRVAELERKDAEGEDGDTQGASEAAGSAVGPPGPGSGASNA
jgi:hypothetical protein